jgi:hypothetical protein
MDLYEWAAGTWYADMAAYGREQYTHLRVGDPEAERIANIIYGMETRAREILQVDDLAGAPSFPPQDQVYAVLRGEVRHVEGPVLRLQTQTADHLKQARRTAAGLEAPDVALHSRCAQAAPSQTK